MSAEDEPETEPDLDPEVVLELELEPVAVAEVLGIRVEAAALMAEVAAVGL